MILKEIWELEVYSTCEHRDGALDYEKCNHVQGQYECVYNKCPVRYMNIIKDFEREVNADGFELEFMDRGKDAKLTISSGRYELWLNSHHQDSKVYFCQTLDALCKFGIPEVRAEMKNRVPGRFSDI